MFDNAEFTFCVCRLQPLSSAEVSSVGYIGCSCINPSFSIDIMGMRAILREAEIAFGVFELKAVGEMVAKGAWLQNTRIQGSPEAGAHSR